MKSEASLKALRPQAMAYSGPVVVPRRLAVAAQLLIAALTALQLALAVAGGTGSELFARSVPVLGPLFVVTVVVFLCWFRRCRLNAQCIAPGTQHHSAGLAVGAWFVPLAMWWIPRRIALDIWRAGNPAGGTWLIEAWWVAWLAKTVGSVAVGRFGVRPAGYSVYDEVVGVIAAVLAILVIQRITDRQGVGAAARQAARK
ncbi:DUF4328 domain-containing protein [Kitasatospora sp. NBC_00240]|uniref:DUF4328 domain-containing protein n=1 Tax=Kitasatospora sp. NBC_00240 TaxID=2903567 RepID=UPI002259E437|nr:DUF4328 domain-containing protein [Kitasatospora sp. NBC_00240]MCX5208116.1 DUF4328 domain-containing protein [Kitasatospora sp. NBC_00240]